jgi:hypothetical protein
VPIVLKSGSLNLLEPSEPVKACNGIALPLPLYVSRQRNGATFKDQDIQEDEIAVLFRKVETQTPNNAASHPRRTDNSTTPLRELKYSHKTQNI